MARYPKLRKRPALFAVEHVTGHRKRSRVASSVYRGSDATYGGAMTVLAGLVDLGAYDRMKAQTGLDLTTMLP